MTGLLQNLFNIPILCFMVGMGAGLTPLSSKLPRFMNQWSSSYLIAAIGIKGGLAFWSCNILDSQAITLIMLALCFSLFFPFLGYKMLIKTTNIDKITCAAIAAHYGSVSISTFAAASSFLAENSIIYCSYIVVVIALMEIPSIFSGLYLAQKSQVLQKMPNERIVQSGVIKCGLFLNKTILILIGALIFGSVCHLFKGDNITHYIIAPFQEILSIFLFTMGVNVAKQSANLRKFTLPSILFGIYMPLLGCLIGLTISWLIGLDLGTGFLFTVLCASASYIIIPAAVGHMLPKAKEAIYLPMSLAITFPFNITLGIPFYYNFAIKILK